MNLKDKIADFPNFPKKGILFRDFSPILKDPSALSYVADEFSKHFHPKDIDVFAGIESRGFIIASILASRYNKGMIMIRKVGKLPGKTTKLAYTIEYGKDTIEIQNDIIKEGEKILICMHGRAMRALLCWLLDYSLRFMEGFPHDNCAYYSLIQTENTFFIKDFNSGEHLH